MGFVNDWRGGGRVVKRALYRVQEVTEILGCSRDHVYDLLSRGKLLAQHPEGRPGARGIRILAHSVDVYLTSTTINPEDWNK